jgi:1-acylglycerone phosphate reductase
MGQVLTGITSPSSVEFGLNSIFTAAEEGVGERGRTHLQNTMTPDEIARHIVSEVLHKKPGLGKREYMWKGTSALTVWLLNAVGWRNILMAP